MTTRYVTPTGLVIPSVSDLLDLFSTDQRSEVDPLLNTEPDSPQGNFNGIFASHLREAYEVLEIAFNAQDPDEAEGSLLEDVSAITGTEREPATRSRLDGTRRATATLDASAALPIGSVASIAGNPAIRFETTEAVTATAAGDYLVAMRCTTTGPIPANANTLTTIATPVIGWQGINNNFDAVLGNDEDSDPQLRNRREEELRATGSATVDAIRADVLAIILDDNSKPILDCTVFENYFDTFSFIYSLPPHSLEVLVYDGVSAATSNDLIAQTIWDTRPGGIQMLGFTSGIAKDSLGADRVVKFSRPAISEIDISVSIEVDASYAGDTITKQALIDRFVQMVKPGSLIRCNDYISALVYDGGKGVAGIVDVPSIQIGLHGGALGANHVNLSLALRQMGDLQAANISITQV